MDTMAATANKSRGSGVSPLSTSPGRPAPGTRALPVLMTALISSALCVHPALALDWNLTPTLSTSARFTDNVNQSATDAQNALILTVTPGFSLVSKGSRKVQATLAYGLTGLARFGEDNSTDLNHNLSAVGKTELIEDFLYMDGSAQISQELISLLGSPADADTNSSNRATVGSYLLSPYIRKRLGNFATAQARVSHSGALFGDNAASNINANALTASLNSGTRFNDFNWAVNYSLREAKYASNGATPSSSSTFETTSATLGYALTRKFRVFGTMGRDSNDFINASESNGNFYTAGFGWSPTKRTSLEASAGKRFSGNTYALSLLHRSHYSNWNVRYSENVSDISQQYLTDNGRLFLMCPAGAGQFSLSQDLNQSGCFGPVTSTDLILNRKALGIRDEDLVAAGLANSTIAHGVFIIKSLTSGVSWSKGKIGVGLSVFDTRRNYLLLTNIEDHTRGVTATANYRLTPNTRINTTLGFTNNQIPAALSGRPTDRDDNLYTTSIGLDHRFDPKVSGALTLRHQQRDSKDPAANFDENSISASLHMRF